MSYSEGRVVRPRLNNRMGYSYRCRVERYTTLFRHAERWCFVVEEKFMEWVDHGNHRGYKSREEAVKAADAWLDRKAQIPAREDYVS